MITHPSLLHWLFQLSSCVPGLTFFETLYFTMHAWLKDKSYFYLKLFYCSKNLPSREFICCNLAIFSDCNNETCAAKRI